ncbi:hypothetical protein FOQG_08750 [Fusarium oxysporum f. sp. raphani 54005]|uniref:Uncharacterized protein n=5 Tax=Fusarium oxysporum TaxID=5507 RepID=X0C158_FUSOX|nr:hypothetical protein FOXG_19142 [Fusarium oxysporum f. sp. lycopersici 4287]EXA46831.1 hypothetical protein FOVG_04139 [Fusarium oxysporum f. sp. pisi HDV247]EXK32987.1 hypothetical protein FOMG_11801 [Fusarium oxysporum f. sp. melonis 26406]EXK87871.1 hypothetical protein FOQG_08750 [Fusarium oxysporum f. sp. raphani 54005]EXM23173.1 hypothetical protein FOTG_09481 [Fusarium oxysporum f. sp. vasinfectum 25433]KNB03419.1 hypothetical protein FOXG_19142 [Fusarium oxysporum f. sp. lycopersici
MIISYTKSVKPHGTQLINQSVLEIIQYRSHAPSSSLQELLSWRLHPYHYPSGVNPRSPSVFAVLWTPRDHSCISLGRSQMICLGESNLALRLRDDPPILQLPRRDPPGSIRVSGLVRH